MSLTTSAAASTLTAERPRVVLIDDHPEVREAMASVLAANGFEVAGQAEDGEAGADLVQEVQPDVVLLDVRMPRKDGLSALEDIIRRRPETKVLMMSIYQDSEYILRAVKSGAKGYLFKGLPAPHFIEAVRKAAAGESSLEPELLHSIRAGLFGNRSPTSNEVIQAHLRAFGALARALLDPDPSPTGTNGFYARVEAVTAYGLAVSVLASAQRSETERLEAALEARTLEIRRAQEKLAAAQRRAALVRMAASAAHGMRNPLAVIENAMTALEMSLKPDPETLGKYARMVHQEVAKADKLLSQLLRYANPEDPDLRPTQIADILRLALAQTEDRERVRVGTVKVGRPALADTGTASEAVAIFLRVALLLAADGEHVRVSSFERQDRAVLRIRPVRLKLKSEELALAFEPLLWTGPVVVNFDLVLSRALAEAQGAEVRLKPEQGEASCLEISWPLAPEASDA